MGYSRAGFEVVGVDKFPQPEYPFEFVQADAIDFLLKNWKGFDIIHASPPCQLFCKYKNCRKDLADRYEDLIEATRDALVFTGKPYVIENVEGAPLKHTITLCGSMFGLDVRRHRLFETNFHVDQPLCNHHVDQPLCNHKILEPTRFPGGRSRERGGPRVLCRGTVEIGRWNIPIGTQQRSMGISWITDLRKFSEIIPPAYTKYIGEQYLKQFSK